MPSDVVGLGLATDGHASGLTVAWENAKAAEILDRNGKAARLDSVAVVGLGYVGLPTALGLQAASLQVVGFDVDDGRLAAIRDGNVDLLPADHARLDTAVAHGDLDLTSDPTRLTEADGIIVCVPTPVDHHQVPDVSVLRAACESVVRYARAGQTLLLTSTTFVGTTRELLVAPLEARGLVVGRDVFVAYSPERIDPGNPAHLQRETTRVVGGVTDECTARGARIVAALTGTVHPVSSPEAAELTKLYENIFRAVTLALANEMAEVCGVLGLDPIEVTIGSATKPYGFLAAFPGPGVGGHCIPCDPHYLLWQLKAERRTAPLVEQAMTSIAARPRRVVERAVEVLADAGKGLRGARVLVAGVAYKPRVKDLRGSPAVEVVESLAARGADVAFHDPLVPTLRLADGRLLVSEEGPQGEDWDLVVLHTLHPGLSYEWAADCPSVLDTTYRYERVPHRQFL